MGWIVSDSKLLSHPKFFNLIELLKVGKIDAFWNLHHLWYWCSDHYPNGVMKDVSDVSIALAAQWPGEPKVFVDALVKSRFVDRESGALVVHDWIEWRPEYLRSRDRRSTEKRPDSDRKATSSVQPSSSVVLSFPVSGEPKTWLLTEDLLKKLQPLYQGIDVLLEAKKALNWIELNPSRKKTARGMGNFLTRWMDRAQNSGRFHKKTSVEKDAEFDAEMKRVQENREKAAAMVKAYVAK